MIDAAVARSLLPRPVSFECADGAAKFSIGESVGFEVEPVLEFEGSTVEGRVREVEGGAWEMVRAWSKDEKPCSSIHFVKMGEVVVVAVISLFASSFNSCQLLRNRFDNDGVATAAVESNGDSTTNACFGGSEIGGSVGIEVEAFEDGGGNGSVDGSLG